MFGLMKTMDDDPPVSRAFESGLDVVGLSLQIAYLNGVLFHLRRHTQPSLKQ